MHLRLLRICLKAPVARLGHMLLLLSAATVYVAGFRRDAHAAQALAGIAVAVATLLLTNQLPPHLSDGD